ncbi:Phage protein [Brachybacterium faecium]|nr:Phage protein [Brachybacterium faecium]
MDIKKTTCLSLEIDSKLKPLSELNVEFYDQDINTSLLRFALKRCGKPINLERVRIEPYIMLVAKDGSKVRDYLTIYDDVNGIVSYTLSTDFLKHTGRVVGQVYVYQQDNILVTRTFAFMIKDSLVNEFSAETKLEYIKTFDDLEMIIKHKVIAIEEAIANGEDYVARMVEALDTGKKEIADTVSKATTDINKVSTDATKNITDTSNAAVATVNSKGDAVLKAFAENGQFPKITNDDGSSITLSGYDLLNTTDVSNFDGYVTTASNVPTTSNNGYFKRKYRIGYIEITFSPHSQKDVYRNAYNAATKNWVGWEKFAYNSDVATTQKRKITSDNGAPLYELNSSNDLFAEITTWGNGFFTFYLSAGATNNPTGSTSWLRGTASTYGKNSNVLAYDKDGAMYTVVCANGVWGIWGKQQMYKTTADDGSSLTLSNYDLLNTADISNFDGYVTNSLNAPSGMSASGFVKRKYRAGYIEVTFAPHSQKDVYRNSYNDASKTWVGWEKAINQSDLTPLIGSNTGWLPLPLLNGVTASTPCFYRFYSTNGIYYLSFKGVLNTLSTRDVIIAKLPAEVITKIDRPLTWVGNTSVAANAARFNRWVVEIDGTIKFAISNFGSAGESGAWNPLDVTLTL